MPIQLGGGLRDLGGVEAAFAAGAERAVLGTSAQRDPDLLGRLADAYGDRIVASVDARGGRSQSRAGSRRRGPPSRTRSTDLGSRGIRRFVYTPVEVDGTLEGPGIERPRPILGACAKVGAELIYSGGVGSLDDLAAPRGGSRTRR